MLGSNHQTHKVMKKQLRKGFIALVVALLAGGGFSTVVTGCGTVRSHWGIEQEYTYGDDGHGPHKPHKPKKGKKPKPGKHGKHHHHD